VEWASADPGLGFSVGVGINRLDLVEVCAFGTHLDGLAPLRGKGSYRLRLELDSLPLVKGAFTLFVYLLDDAGLHVHDQRIVENAFAVENSTYMFGLIHPPHQWAEVGSAVFSTASAEGGE
jgi:hypothetical protein